MIAPSNPPTVALVVAQTVPSDALRLTADTLREFGISVLVTPEFARQDRPDALAWLAAAAQTQGWRAVIVASDDGELPATIATAVDLPVIRVPIGSVAKSGLDLLWAADGNLPAATKSEGAFATVAIGPAGAKNAALLVVSILALDDDRLRTAWEAFRVAQTDAVLRQPLLTLA